MSASAIPKSAVYTALFGGYESLNDAQNVGDGSTRFICFTDDARLTSSVWEIRLVSPLFERDLQRSQRELKIRGCAELDAFERTLYIDNSVTLLEAPEQILDDWLADHDIAIPGHSFRPTVLDEFLAVIEIGLDEPARVYEQLYHYSECSPEALGEQPLWNALIARRNFPETRAVMNRWFDEVLRYSRRDQLSANVILGSSAIRLNRVELDNHSSPIHRWPAAVGRASLESRIGSTRVVPELARVRQLESQLARESDLLAVERERANLHERELADIRETRSWGIARRISAVAAALRLTRRSTSGSQ